MAAKRVVFIERFISASIVTDFWCIFLIQQGNHDFTGNDIESRLLSPLSLRETVVR